MTHDVEAVLARGRSIQESAPPPERSPEEMMRRVRENMALSAQARPMRALAAAMGAFGCSAEQASAALNRVFHNLSTYKDAHKARWARKRTPRYLAKGGVK